MDEQDYTIKRASEQIGINYSTAKHVMKKYREQQAPQGNNGPRITPQEESKASAIDKKDE